MNDSLPFLSVVVPAYNRPEGLRALLEALAEQSYPPYRFEVLVCDDGSEPPLAERVSVKDWPFSVRFLRAPNAGPATARNRGIAEARGAIVAFTDDDCVPDPGWLEAVAEGFRDPAVYAQNGPTRSSVPPIDPFIHSIHIGREAGVATANFAVRKEHLLAIDGFDETFRVPYYEDEDLSRRLQERFGPIAYAEAMVMGHPPRQVGFAKVWRGASFYAFLPYMQRKHAGYAAGAERALAIRVAGKSVLVLVGCLPWLGASPFFAWAWAGLFAWQARRLKRVLSQALAAGVRIPLRDQGQFLAFEWAVDYARLAAYARGYHLEARPRPIVEELQL